MSFSATLFSVHCCIPEISLMHFPAGTNPIHNKKPKKKVVEEDEEDKAFKLKQAAGMLPDMRFLGRQYSDSA